MFNSTHGRGRPRELSNCFAILNNPAVADVHVRDYVKSLSFPISY